MLNKIVSFSVIHLKTKLVVFLNCLEINDLFARGVKRNEQSFYFLQINNLLLSGGHESFVVSAYI